MLLQFSVSYDNFASSICRVVCQNQIETSGELFSWLTILWRLGFRHDNPQGILDLLAYTYGQINQFSVFYFYFLFLIFILYFIQLVPHIPGMISFCL